MKLHILGRGDDYIMFLDIKKTTVKELSSYIYENFGYKNYSGEEDIEIYDIIQKVPKEDISIKFDLENTCTPYDESYDYGPVDDFDLSCDVPGFYQLDEYAIMLCCSGGDEEIPVYYCIYLDNKDNIRMYIPTDGNLFNKYTKTAYGGEQYGDENFDLIPDEWKLDPLDKNKKWQFSKLYENMLCNAEYDMSKMLMDIKNHIK